MAIILQDNFTGTTIDTGKWTETDPNARISQNGNLIFDNPHSSNIAIRVDYLKSILTVTSGTATFQSNLTWTTDSTSEAVGTMYLYVDDNNYININQRTAAGGVYRIGITQTGISVYDFDTTVAKGKDVKITYNISTYDIKFWYWDGGAWVQMGTTQNYNIGTTCYAYYTHADNTAFTGANPVNFDNMYLSDADYSTQYPVSSAIKTINNLAKASVKTVNGLAIASVKTWGGLA